MGLTIEEAYHIFQTPYKYPQYVLKPSGKTGGFDELGVDIPFVFYHQNQFFMLYTGFDGIGYQSALAVSGDLIHWEHRNVVLPRLKESRWDKISTSCAWMLKASDDLPELPRLKKVNQRYWLVYNSYPASGYEEGAAEIGLAWCENDDLTQWHRLEEPVFSWKDGEAWERGGLYNSCLLEYNNMFYLFYNAKNRGEGWKEQIGVAISADMRHWERFDKNPVIPVGREGFDSRFAANPYVGRYQSDFICFYFGYDGIHAQEGIAVSQDLLHWTKSGRPFLTHGEKGSIDEIHAHKPCVFYWKGAWYHFYCGVRKLLPNETGGMYGESRGICVAASVPWERL
jgi:predicted GH43/DUF377 family glycosyl hydrolase